jgi:hypothetical protein
MKPLEIALLAGGAYLLYESGILSSLTGGLLPAPAGSAPATTSTTTGSTSTGSPTNPTTTAPGTPNTLALVAAAAGGANQLLTFDQWNYYYKSVRGIAGPDPSLYLSSANRDMNLSINEWWTYMQQAGLSGLGMLSRTGFGAFKPLVGMTPNNWAHLPPHGIYQPPGGQGMGRWIY